MKKFLFFIPILFSLSLKANIKTCVSTGDWNDSTIWSPMVVPQLTDTTVIPSGYDVIISSTYTAKPYSIVVNGNLRNAGTLFIPGDLEVNGVFLSEVNSKVVFNGSSAQQIIGTGSLSFWDIDNYNYATLDIQADIDLYNNLKADDSSILVLNPGYDFTLKSSSTNTARILPIPVDAIIDGFFTQERWTGAVGYHMIGFTSDGFSCDSYDETVSGYLDNGYNASSLIVGQGGFVENTTAGTVYSNFGPISRDLVAMSLQCSGTDTLNDGWNLVSNPLPCEVDIENPSFVVGGTTDIFYTWNATTKNYIWWKKGVGGTWSNQIASGQGFWVQALDNTAFLKLNEETKITSGTYYRTTQNSDPTFKIKIIPYGSTDTVWSIVRLADGYSDNYEQTNDGIFLEGQGTTVTEVYTKSQNDFKLVVDSRPLSDTIIIPVWLKIPQSNSMLNNTIRFEGINENLPSDYGWYFRFLNGAITTSYGFSWSPGIGVYGYKQMGWIYIYKKPVVLGFETPKVETDLGELIAVYDQQGRLVKPESTGYYIYVYKTKEGNYIRKMKYIFD